jgi:hypothetical protein
LQSNVDDGLRNLLSNSVQELSFSDDNFELRVESHSVLIVAIGVLGSLEDVLLELFDSFIGVLMSPGFENLLFIALIEFLSKLDVFKCSISEALTHKLVSLALELFNWLADSTHDGS